MNGGLLGRSFQSFKTRLYDRSFSSSSTTSKTARTPLVLRTKRAPVPLRHPISSGSEPGWTTKILAAASRSGYLNISVTTAVQILDAFEEKRGLSAEQLCTRYNVKPNILTTLAILLQRSERQQTGEDLLHASARLGDNAAILLVIQKAVSLGNLSNPRVELIYQQHFKPMVQKNHAAALYLEGRKIEGEGHLSRALEVYEKTVTADAETLGTIDGISMADIWKAIGKLRAKRKDRKGAEAAFRTAALEYDDPAALFQLTKTFISPSSTEYESYMLKAAASGEAKAAHELGLLYFKLAQGGISTKNQIHQDRSSTNSEASADSQAQELGSKRTFDLAVAGRKREESQEWFNIAAESGIFRSQVYLALLLRGSGKFKDGLEWLKLARSPKDLDAKTLPAWKRVITYFADNWDDPDFELNHIVLEKMLEGRLDESHIRDFLAGG